jgi:hypothetical protein
MTRSRAALAAAVRPFGPGGSLLPQHIASLDALADALGLPADTAPRRLTLADLHDRIGIAPDVAGYGEAFGPMSEAALNALLSNPRPAALTDADFQAAADKLGVAPRMMKAVRKVEAPRGAFDDQGRPTILYERHVFRRNTEPRGHFDAIAPALSGAAYGPGGYGAYSAQYGKLFDACALDPEAAFRACSWGAFQVLGENAEALGYASALDMAVALANSEAAHLDSFVRFVRANGLADELRACRPGDATSCVPFVSKYNGPGYAQFAYHFKLAEAAR